MNETQIVAAVAPKTQKFSHQLSLRLRYMQLVRDQPYGDFTVFVTVRDLPLEDSSNVIQSLEQSTKFQFIWREYRLYPIYQALAAYGGLKLLVVNGSECLESVESLTTEQRVNIDASSASAEDNGNNISIPLVFQNGLRQLVSAEYKEQVFVTKVVHKSPTGVKNTFTPPAPLAFPPTVNAVSVQP